MLSLQALQTPRLESRTPSEKSARLQVAADDEPIAAAGRHEPPGCRTQLQTAPSSSFASMDFNSPVKGVVVVVAVEDLRLAEFELRSPAKPQHFGGFEGQRV